MKKIIGIILAAFVLFTSCVTQQTRTATASIIVELPSGTELNVRVKTISGKDVEVIGAETKTISGTDEVRELGEDKPMQKVTAQGTVLAFIGDICEFDIKDNKVITGIDVSNVPNLEVLYCAGNAISKLDLSNNKKLKRLQCYNNRLTMLDLQNQQELTLLWCGINRFTSLDVSSCVNLEQLRCYRNSITANAMDSLLRSLPQKAAGVNAEARILAVGEAISNQKPSKTAIEEANQKGWKILDSGDSEVK